MKPQPDLIPVHQDALAELRGTMSGVVVSPGDERYPDACRVWNGAVRHRPAMIAVCEQVVDVQAAVRAARRHGLPLCVRGAGHDWAGRAVQEGALVVDLSRMRDVIVDPGARVATVGGGAKVTDLVGPATAAGLVAALGRCGGVGVTGLTLGGGYGPLNGSCGLAADNLLGAELVLADGRRVLVGPDQEPDLFWAIRGGGGNFGVVTTMRVRLHEVHAMLAGVVVYPWSEAVDVLRRYGGLAAAPSGELDVSGVVASGPDGEPAMTLLPLWNGDRCRGERVLDDLRALGTPRFAQYGPATYGDVLAPADAKIAEAEGCHWKVWNRWLPELSRGAIGAIVEAFSRRTSPYSMIDWHHFHGAATRVAPHSTPFGLRRAHFSVTIMAGWRPDGDDGATHRRWGENLWRDLAPFALPGGYANALAPDNQEQATAAYGGNAARLRQLKRRFDPDDVFTSAILLPDR